MHYRRIQNPYQNSQIVYKIFLSARFWVLGLHKLHVIGISPDFNRHGSGNKTDSLSRVWSGRSYEVQNVPDRSSPHPFPVDSLGVVRAGEDHTAGHPGDPRQSQAGQELTEQEEARLEQWMDSLANGPAGLGRAGQGQTSAAKPGLAVAGQSQSGSSLPCPAKAPAQVAWRRRRLPSTPHCSSRLSRPTARASALGELNWTQC